MYRQNYRKIETMIDKLSCVRFNIVFSRHTILGLVSHHITIPDKCRNGQKITAQYPCTYVQPSFVYCAVHRVRERSFLS